MGTTIGGIGGGIAAEFALLEIEQEQASYTADAKAEHAARLSKRAADDAEIASMHEKADEQRSGAWVSGGLQIGAGAMQLGAAGAQYQSDRATLSGDGIAKSGIAQADLPLATREGIDEYATEARSVAIGAKHDAAIFTASAASMQGAAAITKGVYEANAEDTGATATKHRHQSEEASWQAEQASKRKDRAQRDLDQNLTTLQSFQQAEAQAGAAVVLRG